LDSVSCRRARLRDRQRIHQTGCEAPDTSPDHPHARAVLVRREWADALADELAVGRARPRIPCERFLGSLLRRPRRQPRQHAALDSHYRAKPRLNRRAFFKTAGAGSALALVARTTTAEQETSTPVAERQLWVDVLRRLADPVLRNLANG